MEPESPLYDLGFGPYRDFTEDEKAVIAVAATFIRATFFSHWSNIVKFDGKYYLADTAYTEKGWETMIFASRPQKETDCREDIDGSKVDWRDLYAEWPKTEEAAEARHKEIVQNIGLYLPYRERRRQG